MSREILDIDSESRLAWIISDGMLDMQQTDRQRHLQATDPDSFLEVFDGDNPLQLESGITLAPFQIAYQCYGELNRNKSNAILICHPLTCDQHVANPHPVTGKPGWWATMVGEGKVFDTRKYFIICANVLGGCLGTTGPMSIDPRTGCPYALDFPVITIGDIVESQAMLLNRLGIDTLFAVVGGSMGGMQALKWASKYKDRVFSAILLATTSRHSAQNIAFGEIGRQAIMADPDWCGGRYLEKGRFPAKGLAVARMTAHITYLSEAVLHRKFGRNLQDRQQVTFGFDADFQVESYLRHQGSSFVERFDANSYLYLTRAMDYFDLAGDFNGSLATAFKDTQTRFFVASFSTDWLFATEQSRVIVHALNAAGASVSFAEIQTDKGHDAFLLEEEVLFAAVSAFLSSSGRERGLDNDSHATMQVSS